MIRSAAVAIRFHPRRRSDASTRILSTACGAGTKRSPRFARSSVRSFPTRFPISRTASIAKIQVTFSSPIRRGGCCNDSLPCQ